MTAELDPELVRAIAAAAVQTKAKRAHRAKLIEEAAEETAEQRLQRDEDLHRWIQDVLGINIPTVGVCDGHDAPFDFVADLFFHRVSDALVLANRAGGKTQDVACLHLANGKHKPGFETSHIGAIKAQALRCYRYYVKGLGSEELREEAPDPHIGSTIWRNGSSIEILPGTEAQTQGGHPNLVTFDELEQGRRQPYENAKGMPVEWLDDDGVDRIGQFVATSTRESSLGMMQRALDEAAENGTTRIYEWCVLEVINGATCRDDQGQALCESCPLFASLEDGGGGCEGRALDAKGWRSRREIVTAYQRVGQDTWVAQYLCQKPEARSLVYSNFSAANVTEDAEFVPDGGPIYVGYDWGFTDPACFTLNQYRDGTFYQFDELTGNQTSERDWVHALIRKIMDLPGYSPPEYRSEWLPGHAYGPSWEEWQEVWQGKRDWPDPWPSVWIDVAAGDPSAVQLRTELREHGITATDPARVRQTIEEGQGVLRAAIKTGPDLHRYRIHPRCRVTISAFQNYRSRQRSDGSFEERPDPDPGNHAFSHPTDAQRYLVFRFRRLLGLGALGEGSSET